MFIKPVVILYDVTRTTAYIFILNVLNILNIFSVNLFNRQLSKLIKAYYNLVIPIFVLKSNIMSASN